MKREEALKRTEQALAELGEALSEGKSETLVAYLDTMARFHHYSFGNCMLIAIQRPNATLVAGFQRWKQLGRYVKKGEKGIVILAPLVRRKKADETPAASEDADGEGSGKVFGFRAVRVFDVAQTDGKPLSEFSRLSGEPGEKLDKLRGIVSARRITLSYEESLSGAEGVSLGGEIKVLAGLAPGEEFAVLAHELAHELLHRTDRRKETTRSMRELEAEAVAYVVCQAAGLDSKQRSADYIQLYTGDMEVFQASLEHIRRVASDIVGDLEAKPPRDAEESAARVRSSRTQQERSERCAVAT